MCTVLIEHSLALHSPCLPATYNHRLYEKKRLSADQNNPNLGGCLKKKKTRGRVTCSLGARDAKTLMFVNVSPNPNTVEENLNSLRFATKAFACQTDR